ncbi:hybrid sensor histidine kinase/response regulator [Chitinivibrio alkaliphilus]|uniref:histidine kinase n=1 Tax=Chitinivibrio alkaliphilus ACht1 TaxID=1313304 RepID=U7DDE4_9BACT|nr:ATP-binding protein [Chitinivibrio alkaliphilus]ERP38906.1 PAS/PAC sensor hybrid histidine kinase [Chitinivibrio alkaliphilus ACht1]
MGALLKRGISRCLQSPFCIILLYFCISITWIAFSDAALERITHDTGQLTFLQTWKGFFFVTATTIFLYALIRTMLNKNIETIHKKYQLITDIPHPIMEYSSQDKITFLNPAFTETFGYTREELPNYSSWCTKAVRTPSSEHQDVPEKGISYDVRDLHGTIHHVQLFSLQQGEKTLLLFKDITEQLAQKQAIALSEKMRALGELAGGISHDFNNQLSAIHGVAELLKEDKSLSKDGRENLDIILAATHHAATLTEKLSSFSRKDVPEFTPVHFTHLLRTISTICERTFNKDIHVTHTLPKEDIFVHGNKSALQNALLNIVLNARDAMPEGGTLAIRLTKDGPTSLLLTISDTGCGIPEAIQDRIFEPFFTTKDPGHGLGMGLASAYTTLEKHGGTIEIESSPERGSVFKITLPRTDKKEDIPAEEEYTLSSKNTPRKRILIADDEPAVQRILAKIIAQRLHHSVHCCSNGIEAVEYAEGESSPIDLAILDIIMPEMDGVSAAQELRKIQPNMKIIFISGFSEEQQRKHINDMGAQGFLAKPFSLATITAEISRVLS